MINSRGKRVVREAVFLPTFVFVRVEDKNLNEIHFRSDVYKMLSEPGKSAPYAIPDSKFNHFSEREFEEKVSPILGHSVHFCQDNESMSSYGVMRSLHFQCPPYTQSNLVRCVKGRVLDDTLGIDWKIPTEHANLSEKDTKHAMLKDFDSPFDINMNLHKIEL